MPFTVPPRLVEGDRLHVIAPSRTLPCLMDSELERENHALATRRLESLGLRVTFGRYVNDDDLFRTTSVERRLDDLHEAFRDPDVAAVMTVIGGLNANQLLRSIDFDLIADNPKVFCGYSDITVLNAAILARSNLLNYSGPHHSTFGMRDGIEYTLSSFRRAVFDDAPYLLEPSSAWSDDPWFLDQDDRTFVKNSGYQVLAEGEAEGRIVGGHLGTLLMLAGTEFMPNLEGAVLFVEQIREAMEFDRLLQSLLHQPGAEGVRGIVIGRFPNEAAVTRAQMDYVIGAKPECRGMPVIWGADFGHTCPHTTLPIGGRAQISARGNAARIEILEH
jgi:muramoyltetrapeptide carboxypeptidase